MGDPARHSSRHVPTILAGGEHVPFAFGRYLDLRGGQDKQEGVPNNRLLVSICRLFGVETPRFGHAKDPAIAQGELEALRA
jgi:hypothetical protein